MRNIVAKDIENLVFCEQLKASPDGAKLIVSVKRIHEDAYISHLYLFDIQQQELLQLTFQPSRDRLLAWSEDSSRIYFLSKRSGDDKNQLYTMSIAGGEAEKLMEIDGNILSFAWLKDQKEALVLFHENALSGKKHKDKVLYYEIDRPYYKADGKGFLPKGFPQVYRLDLQAKTWHVLFRSQRKKADLVVDDNKQFAYFITNVQANQYDKPNYYDVIKLDLTTGKHRVLPMQAGPKSALALSPKGDQLAVVAHTHTDSHTGSRPYELFIYPIASGKPVHASPGIADSLQHNVIHDMSDVSWVVKPQWRSDGKRIVFGVSENGAYRLYAYELEHHRLSSVSKADYTVLNFSAQDDRVYALITDAATPAELYAIDSATGEKRQLTFFNRDFLRTRRVAEPREFRVKVKDRHVSYWVMQPPDKQAGKRYPAVLEVHGGPHTQYGRTFFFEFQVLAAAGYVVVYSNPTGSMGYGYDFAAQLDRRWGIPDTEDIRAVMAKVQALPYVDKDRLGVTGGSYGGFMTNWLLSHTRLFKAGVTQRCVANALSMAENCDFCYYMPKGWHGKFWRNVSAYWEMSPIRYVDKIDAPLLIIHSSNDQRTPLNQAESLYVALKMRKKRTKLIIFPEESHGLSRAGNPAKRVARLQWILRWFDKHI